MQFLENNQKMFLPIRGHCRHPGFQITQKSNKTFSEPLEEHLWQIWWLHDHMQKFWRRRQKCFRHSEASRFWKRSKNISPSRRLGQLSLIMNHSKKLQHFFRIPKRTFLGSVATSYTKVLEKRGKQCLETGAAMLDFKSLGNIKTFLQQHWEIMSDTYVSANLRQRWPSWILYCSEKKQHFYKTLRGTFMVSLVTGHAAVLKKLNL